MWKCLQKLDSGHRVNNAPNGLEFVFGKDYEFDVDKFFSSLILSLYNILRIKYQFLSSLDEESLKLFLNSNINPLIFTISGGLQNPYQHLYFG